MDIMELPRIDSYVGVSHDVTIKHNDNEYRIIIYGAYDAMGLIGSEVNGIAIFDVTKKRVLLDGECKQDTGWYGPEDNQVSRFNDIISMTTEEFRTFVNTHKRARYFI